MKGIVISSHSRQQSWATFFDKLKSYQLIVNGCIMKKSTIFDLLYEEDSNNNKLKCIQDRSVDCFVMCGATYKIKFKERPCASYDGKAEEEKAVRKVLVQYIEKHPMPKDEREFHRILLNLAFDVHSNYDNISIQADKQHKKI